MAKIVGIDLGTTKRKLFMSRFLFGSKFNSHNIGNNDQRGRNPEQSGSNLGTIKNLIELFWIHCDNLSQTIATINDTIAKANAFVNLVASRLTNPGAINIRPIQPAQRFPLIPVSTLKNDLLTLFTLAKIQNSYNNTEMAKIVDRKEN